MTTEGDSLPSLARGGGEWLGPLSAPSGGVDLGEGWSPQGDLGGLPPWSRRSRWVIK